MTHIRELFEYLIACKPYLDKFKEALQIAKIGIKVVPINSSNKPLDTIDSFDQGVSGTMAGSIIENYVYQCLCNEYNDTGIIKKTVKHEPNNKNTFPDFRIDKPVEMPIETSFSPDSINIDCKATIQGRFNNALCTPNEMELACNFLVNDNSNIFPCDISQPYPTFSSNPTTELFSFISFIEYSLEKNELKLHESMSNKAMINEAQNFDDESDNNIIVIKTMNIYPALTALTYTAGDGTFMTKNNNLENQKIKLGMRTRSGKKPDYKTINRTNLFPWIYSLFNAVIKRQNSAETIEQKKMDYYSALERFIDENLNFSDDLRYYIPQAIEYDIKNCLNNLRGKGLKCSYPEPESITKSFDSTQVSKESPIDIQETTEKIKTFLQKKQTSVNSIDFNNTTINGKPYIDVKINSLNDLEDDYFLNQDQLIKELSVFKQKTNSRIIVTKPKLSKFLSNIEKYPQSKEEINMQNESFKYTYKNRYRLFEGGNAIQNAEPIRGDLALPVAKEIMSILKEKWPRLKMSPLGSTGKKGKDQMSGDIDIAIQLPFSISDSIIEYLETRLPDCEINKLTGLNIVSIGYKYNIKNILGIVQVDLMFVNNVDYAAFYFHSPSYIKNESQFKGMIRNKFIFAVLREIPTGIPEKEDNNGNIIDFWKYTMKPEGLVLMHQTKLGNNGKILKTKKTVKSDTKVISQDPEYIVKFMLGDKGNIADLNSFESLYSFITGNSFKYKNKTNFIIKEFLKDIKESAQSAVFYNQLVSYIKMH